MTAIEIWFLGIALAMDCFTVSIAAGLTQKKVISGKMLAMILAFGLFQGGMTWIGFTGASLAHNLIESTDHWIAFTLLCYLGGKMIWESLKGNEKEKSSLLTWWNIPTLAVATSIDALAVGVSFACLDNISSSNIMNPVCIIALCSSLFTTAGLGIGIFAGKKLSFPVEAIGGLILIGIGVKILIEHLCA